MGDLIGDVVESELYYVPTREFERVRKLNAARPQIVVAVRRLARLNALYMIARAGSGHIGSSFSSLDILSHLYLSEMDRREGRRLLLLQGARCAGALCGDDRGRDPARRQIAWSAPTGRATGTSGRRHARHRDEYRLARHGHLQGQGHARGQSPQRQDRSRLRHDRRRRAAGGPDLGVARFGRERGHGRAHGDRRPQQDPVRLSRSSEPRASATSTRSFVRSAGMSRASTATTPTSSRRHSPRWLGSPTSRRSSSPTR